MIGLLELAVGLGHGGHRTGKSRLAGPGKAAQRSKGLAGREAARAALAGALLALAAGGLCRAQQVEPAAPGPAAERAAPSPADASRAAAEAYFQKGKAALALELEVQDYERATLGLEDPATLSGWRLKRRERIEADREFVKLAGLFTLKPLEFPTPAQLAGAGLGRRALTLVANVQAAYDASRRDKVLEQLTEANRSFLQNADWAQRDRAVILRDDLLTREIGFTRLAAETADLAAGRLGPEDVVRLEQLLAEIAPVAAVASKPMAVLVLEDENLRTQVVADLHARLARPAPAPTLPPPAVELQPLVTKLQLKLMTLHGLAEIIAEHGDVSAAIEELAPRIEELEARREMVARHELVAQMVSLVRRRAALEEQWYTIVPDPGTWGALVQAQDDFIARQIFDLGPKGALFAARRDAVDEVRATGTPDPAAQWRLIEMQRDLLLALAEARPPADPLEGLAPPPLLSVTLMQQAQAAAAGGKVSGKGGKKAPPGGPKKAVPKPKPKGGLTISPAQLQQAAKQAQPYVDKALQKAGEKPR